MRIRGGFLVQYILHMPKIWYTHIHLFTRPRTHPRFIKRRTNKLTQKRRRTHGNIITKSLLLVLENRQVGIIVKNQYEAPTNIYTQFRSNNIRGLTIH